MKFTDYTAWSECMRSVRGRWFLDRKHDGVTRDLLAYVVDFKDLTTGVFLMVDGPTIESGWYENADPKDIDYFTTKYHVMFGMSMLDGTRPHFGLAKPSEAALEVIRKQGVIR